MSISNARLDSERAISDTIRIHWALFLGQGIIMVVLGVLAVIWPQISTLAVDLYVGWMFLISGLTGLFAMFLAASAAGFLWSMLTAALSLFIGVLLLWHPVEGAVSLTLCSSRSSWPKESSRSPERSGIATHSPTPGAGC